MIGVHQKCIGAMLSRHLKQVQQGTWFHEALVHALAVHVERLSKQC